MGRHVYHLSHNEGKKPHCERCDKDLKHEVCLCCGSGSVHVCRKYPKCGEWALGTNRGCDKHLAKTDYKFPKEFPDCEHVKAEKKRYGF